MSGELGTLSVKIGADVSEIKNGVNAATKELQANTASWKKMFATTGGEIGRFGEQINNIREGLQKAFGDNAPKMMQDLGKEFSKLNGLTDEQMKAIGQWGSALGGTLKAIGTTFAVLMSPIGIFIVMMGSLGLAAAQVAKNWDGLTEAFNNGLESLSKYLPLLRAVVWMRDQMQKDQKARDDIAWLNEMDKKYNPELAKFEKTGTSESWSDKAISLAKENVYEPLKESFDYLKDKVKDLLPKGFMDNFLKVGVKEADVKKANEEIKKANQEKLKNAFEAMKAEQEAEEKLQQELEDIDEEYLTAKANQHDKDLKDMKAIEENFIAEDIKNWEESNAKRAKMYQQQNEDFADTIQGYFIKPIKDFLGNKIPWQEMTPRQTVGNVAGTGANIFASTAIQQNAGANTQSAMSGAVQGFSSGGPWGAVIGALASLAASTENVRSVFDEVEKIISAIKPTLNALFLQTQKVTSSFSPLIQSVLKLFPAIIKVVDAIGNTLMGLQLVFKIAEWLQPLAESLDNFSLSLEGAANSVLSWLGLEDNEAEKKREEKKKADADNLSKAVDQMYQNTFGTFDQMMSDVFGRFKNAVEQLVMLSNPEYVQNSKEAWFAEKELAEKQASLEAQWKAEWDAIHGIDQLAEASESAATELQKFNESISNMAQGYKVKSAQYNAIDAGSVPSFASGGYVAQPTLAVVGDAPGGEYIVPASKAGGVVININGVTDPKSVAEEVMRRLQRENFLTSGSPVGGALGRSAFAR